jgi:hypothetical protein
MSLDSFSYAKSSDVYMRFLFIRDKKLARTAEDESCCFDEQKAVGF